MAQVDLKIEEGTYEEMQHIIVQMPQSIEAYVNAALAAYNEEIKQKLSNKIPD